MFAYNANAVSQAFVPFIGVKWMQLKFIEFINFKILQNSVTTHLRWYGSMFYRHIRRKCRLFKETIHI